MKSIFAIQIKPLDGLASGVLREFNQDDFDRLRGLGAVRQATDDEIKAAPQHLNKMALAPLNKDIGAQRDANGDTSEMAQLRRMFDASFSQQGQVLQTANGQISLLTGKLTTLESEHAKEVENLKASITSKDSEIAALREAAAIVPLKAVHHGGGKYDIMQGNTMLSTGLSRADADAFNAMSDEDKAAFAQAKPDQEA